MGRKDKARARSGPPAQARAVAIDSLWFAAAASAPLFLRVATLTENRISPGVQDLHGAISDLALAALVGLGAGLLARRWEWGGFGLVLVWTFASYGNFEHIIALGANAALANAGYLADRTFLEGSALAVTRPGVLLIALACTGAIATWSARTTSAAAARSFRWPLWVGAAILLVVAQGVWPLRSDVVDWRQQHFLWGNVRAMLVVPPDPPLTNSLADSQVPAADRRPDFSGSPWTKVDRRGVNVLLVLLEGVSGAFVPPIARANQRETLRFMPRLGELANEHATFTNFIAQQRQTNRGEYALLCGDSAKLTSAEPKMTELAEVGQLPCLPDVLRAAGYQTVYLQAAPLGFMLKDRFMPQIGFERSHGTAWFREARQRNKWGVDDRSFLERSLAMVDELRREERPWFLTLLSVGTHHPPNVPPDFEAPAHATSDWERSFAYLDLAIGEFVEGLRERGVFDDTLVLFSSDESRGLHGSVDDATRVLSQSWGYLIAAVPGGEARLITEPQTQLDLPASVLDFVGETDRARGLSGRSVFRSYSKPRTLAFGNTYLNMVSALQPDGSLVMCRENFSGCVQPFFPKQQLFAPGIQLAGAADPQDVARLRNIANASLRTPWTGATVRTNSKRRVVPLVQSDVFDIQDDVEGLQWVFGGQSMAVVAGSRISVELDFEVVGDSGRVTASHALRTAHSTLFGRRIRDLGPTDRLVFRYEVRADQSIPKLETYLLLERQEGQNLQLRFHAARMELGPAGDGTGEPLEIHAYQLIRGGKKYEIRDKN